jgi:hypothetical protein
MVKRSIFAILSIFAASNIWACYDPAGSGQCGPNGIGPRNPSGYNNSVGNNGGYYDPSRVPLPPIVITLPDKWGAIAVNSTTFASAYNMNSKQEARQKALKDCQYRQKEPCVIYGDYANRCISLVQGWDKNRQRGYLVSAQSRGRGQIGRKALKKCSTQYVDCRFVIEEECSLPERPD